MTLEDHLEADNVTIQSDVTSSTSSENEEETDHCDHMMNNEEATAVAWGSVLAGTLRRAARQGRLTCGVAAAAQVLERGTSTVRLCVLAPSSVGGGLLHLHSVLLEAHCYENNIPTIKVDSVEKLRAIVGPSCECILVHSVRQTSYNINQKTTTEPCKMQPLQDNISLGEGGLLAAARDGTHPSVLILPVSPPP